MSYKKQLARTHEEQQQYRQEYTIARRYVLSSQVLYWYWGFMIAVLVFQVLLATHPWWLTVAPAPFIISATVYLINHRSRIIQFLLAMIAAPLPLATFAHENERALFPPWMIGGLLSLFLVSAIYALMDIHGAYMAHRDTIAWNINRVLARLDEDRAAFAQRTTGRQRRRNKSGSGNFTETEWMDLCYRYGHMCLKCKQVEPAIMLTPDHVVPLSHGGTNEIDNIQPLCLACNVRKNARYVDYREGV